MYILADMDLKAKLALLHEHVGKYLTHFLSHMMTCYYHLMSKDTLHSLSCLSSPFYSSIIVGPGRAGKVWARAGLHTSGLGLSRSRAFTK
jgi:hypothetical protein